MGLKVPYTSGYYWGDLGAAACSQAGEFSSPPACNLLMLDANTMTFGSAAMTLALHGTSDYGTNSILFGAMKPARAYSNKKLSVADFDATHPGAYAAKFDINGNLVWLATFNGTVLDQGSDVYFANDKIYGVGFTNSSNFSLQSPIQQTRGGGMDAFLAELSQDGQAQFSTFFGGSGNDRAEGVAADSEGNIYIAGYTDSTDFPTASALQGVNAGKNDTFIAKFNSNHELLWSTYFGGTGDDSLSSGSLTIDSNNNVIITGATTSTDLATTSNAVNDTALGGEDAFIAKFSTNGALLYTSYLGGTGDDWGRQVRVDRSDNAYVVGDTDSTDLFVKNPEQASAAGEGDIFMMKINSTGSLVFSTYIGGNHEEWGASVAVSPIGNVYVAGITQSKGLNTSDANLTYQNKEDGFLQKYTNAGVLVHGTYIGGNETDRAMDVYVDRLEKVFVIGDTNSTDFMVAPLQPHEYHGGQGDGFIASYNFYPAPQTSSFNGPDTTNFTPSKIPDLHNVVNMTLDKDGGKVRWNSDVYASLQDFDTYVKMGSNFVSMNMRGLDSSFNSSANVTFTGINCASFVLYYATGFYSTNADLVNHGVVEATQAHIGHDCDDASVCRNVRCSGGVLTFKAMHFDGFGGGGAGAAVPEFGAWALLIAVCATVAGMLFLRSRKTA
jgi:hypothetical protein